MGQNETQISQSPYLPVFKMGSDQILPMSGYVPLVSLRLFIMSAFQITFSILSPELDFIIWSRENKETNLDIAQLQRHFEEVLLSPELKSEDRNAVLVAHECVSAMQTICIDWQRIDFPPENISIDNISTD
ncbi:hypothetical protein [Sphingomonas solaris]|uniref:Uncharacterized protein n=1 Tax=Alterirhizorhabdus solaris TaxID=2529389 RepID=A0A558RCW7_9SPHN|nr:hypothetical protein [Sphingomonas solaris]TVV77173.1 hypothetical protein FOY91_02280 [Sphingomonas solaris]